MVEQMEPWDWIIYGVAGYVAVAVLVRLMLNRRNALIGELREKFSRQRKNRQKSATPGAPAKTTSD